MSIIQEALEKAQSDVKPVEQEFVKVPAVPVTKKAPAAKKMSITSKRVLMAVMLLALMAFAVFSAGRFLTRTNNGTSAADSQEVSYKPLVRGREQAKPSPEAMKAPESPRLVLNGIMYLEDGPRAIINNLIVGSGDMVSGARVTGINRQSVVLEYENVEITLSLK